MSLYPGEDLIAQATDLCLAAGVRSLATHLYGPDERAHARALLGWMRPPQGAQILDAGCGVGEVARLMREERPDLQFTLLNLNRHQLELCPLGAGFTLAVGDFHASGLPAGAFDVVMFNTSICHAELARALAEAARLLRPGGKVFVSDVVRLSGDNADLEATLHVRAYTPAEWLAAAAAAGLIVRIEHPEGNPGRFRAMLGEPLFEHLFGALLAAVITLHKP